eukprot:CAMPEP_0197522800 /NCGR_PEP_ID=MMETSP1318-20131121/7867_1 /TAXON_ID=552666 /ORGANISM="Partenskyella glossopodia, Strain RCC365" /LENGTH=349 /DNA_ID=CAMNT_0043075285 /DNA_START=641 /DNA_END=1690 /DNA_ORIENTATION=+
MGSVVTASTLTRLAAINEDGEISETMQFQAYQNVQQQQQQHQADSSSQDVQQLPTYTNNNLDDLKQATKKTPIRLVTFDFTGTLAMVKGNTADHYLAALKDTILSNPKLGEKAWETLEKEDPAIHQRIVPAFASAYKRQMQVLPNFGYGSGSSEDWWKAVIIQTFNCSGVPKALLDEVKDQVSCVLYKRFATSAAWELYPEVPSLIRALNASGITLGVVSNFDSRLGPILSSLGIDSYFRFVLTSGELGVEKPSRKIFEEAMALGGVDSAEEMLHVGDTVKTDVVGPIDFGMPFVYVQRVGDELKQDDSPQAKTSEEVLAERGSADHDALAMKRNTVRNLTALADIVIA